jgi:hypothetical protein
MSGIKGTVKIDKYEAELIDGEWVPIKLIETIEEKNRVTINLLDAIKDLTTQGRDDMTAFVSEGIFVGAVITQPDDGDQWVSSSQAASNTYTPPAGAADAYHEFQSTVNPPGAGTRNIRSICLTSDNSNYDDKAWTIVSLPTPCTQTSTEILQITYRLINDQSAVAALGTISSSVSTRMFQNICNESGSIDYVPNNTYLLNYDSKAWGKGLSWRGSANMGRTISTTSSNQEIYRTGVSKAFTDDFVGEGLVRDTVTLRLGINNVVTSNEDPIGMPIKGFSIGANAAWSSISDVGKGSLSSVGNIFGRAADTASVDRTPYLSNAIIATSAASVDLVDNGDWVEHTADSYLIPYIYRITVETGGNVGTATYKVKRRRSPCRWVDNSPRWIPHGMPFLHANLINNTVDEEYMDITTADTRKHGQTITHSRPYEDANTDSYTNRNDLGETRTIIHRYVYPEQYSWDYEGLTFFSFNEHNWINLDANSAQAQTFTEILQVGSDGLDVYVADASQGLYKIERDFGDFNTSNWTITKLNPPGITNTNSCRGVFLKGGSYWGQTGKVVDMNIIRGGSNYAVDDTITITGVNGTSATANVARVDGDGAITAVAVTNQGSGYLEDHIQAYVSSGSGVGAQLEPLIGAGGNLWAIFNDVTDSAVYLSHMTHVGSNDYTSLNFDTTGDTITRTGGTDFLVDGFRPGQALIVRSAEDAANEGRFTITAVTSTVITVSENLTTNTTDTQAQLFGESWEVMKETITTTESLTFADANPDTITGSGTSFITQGFVEGMEIVISGSVSNNGTYTIADVTATVITVDSQDTLVAEGPVSCTMASLTDFTITNYTANSTEGAGFIGLVMDTDHADDRFAMLTPDTKQVNDGVTLQGTAGFDWWSFANSTGTTAAGTTDRVRAAGHNNTNRSGSLEQLATQTIGPLTDSSVWVVAGLGQTEVSSYTWGSGTRTTRQDHTTCMRYIPHRCQTNFDTGVVARGTEAVAAWKSNRTTTHFTDTTYDSIMAYEAESNVEPNLVDYNTTSYGGNQGNLMGCFGRGLHWDRMHDDWPAAGGFVVGFNSDGTIAGEATLPYGTWQEFGWDGTRWVLDNASARTTHAQSSFSGTSLNINATTGAIVGTGFASTDWAGDGFAAGDTITIATAEDPTNDGQYKIETLSGTTLTVTPNKLPAVTNTDDTTATVVGDRAFIDGLALSFDDSGATAPLVVDEYYDCFLYDGIINDNATDGTITGYQAWLPTNTGTDFESSTIPNSDVGTVLNEPVTMRRHSAGLYDGAGPTMWNEEPGVWAFANISGGNDELAFGEQQIPASTDFTLRFKIAGTDTTHICDVGVVPYTLTADGIAYTDTSLDYNARVQYNFTTNPALDQYDVIIRNTGSGTIQHTEAADRVVLIQAQDETSYDASPGTEGTFIGGLGTASDTHAALDVITMNDGSVITVDAVDGNGTITQFTVTTNSTKTSGNSQIGAVSSSAGAADVSFSTTGDTITRGSGSFLTDGFRIGMKIAITGAATASNNGNFTIATVTATVITTEETLGNTEASQTVTIDHAIVQESTTGTGVNFALIPGADNLEAAAIGGDEYALNRRGTTGNNLYWTLNGVEFYTHTSGPFNAQYGIAATAQNTLLGGTMYDMNLDHTIDRRYLKVGNGTTTGAFDQNFRCLPTQWAGTAPLQLYYDSGGGPVEFTYVTDGRTAPASGEVTILPYSGVLWFNTAQAGDTLTGNWTTTLKINLS